MRHCLLSLLEEQQQEEEVEETCSPSEPERAMEMVRFDVSEAQVLLQGLLRND